LGKLVATLVYTDPISGLVTTTWDMIKGRAQGRQERLETWQVPGVDGYGAQRLGVGESPLFFRLIKFDSIATLNTLYGNLLPAKKYPVTITDDRGIVYTNCIIEMVGEFDPVVAYNPAAPTNFRVEVIVQGKLS